MHLSELQPEHPCTVAMRAAVVPVDLVLRSGVTLVDGLGATLPVSNSSHHLAEPTIARKCFVTAWWSNPRFAPLPHAHKQMVNGPCGLISSRVAGRKNLRGEVPLPFAEELRWLRCASGWDGGGRRSEEAALVRPVCGAHVGIM